MDKTDEDCKQPQKSNVEISELFQFHDYLKRISNPSHTIVQCIDKLEEQISTVIMSLKIST